METQMTPDIADLPPRVRWRRALVALAKILRDPEQTEQVLVFSSYANAGRRDQQLHRFFDDPRGQKLYDEQRTIDSRTVDLDALSSLPEGTLGHAYAVFMKANGLTPNIFDGSPEQVHDPRAAYIIQRMRQTHDLWHVITNAYADPAGEVALQAFTFAQVRAPSTGILAALGTVRTIPYTRRIVRDVIDMYRLGEHAEQLVVFPWEDHWATPLSEVRRLLGLPESPRQIGGYTTHLLAAMKANRAAAA